MGWPSTVEDLIERMNCDDGGAWIGGPAGLLSQEQRDDPAELLRTEVQRRTATAVSQYRKIRDYILTHADLLRAIGQRLGEIESDLNHFDLRTVLGGDLAVRHEAAALGQRLTTIIQDINAYQDKIFESMLAFGDSVDQLSALRSRGRQHEVTVGDERMKVTCGVLIEHWDAMTKQLRCLEARNEELQIELAGHVQNREERDTVRMARPIRLRRVLLSLGYHQSFPHCTVEKNRFGADWDSALHPR